ncbi:hypothetical protein Q4574_11100 [Aliiglaciecola sp. 3_MG-2023]|uniref:hypothetical protein n=1 Tax=Aliiglaciecola sp. 3_MG-2023 TaxID=3062644 RepID=UPI0026E3EC94|nr:hypothetical protein [Aliiglaciecola sp. 3_MG-2023]MDO6693836.1 hypothetical protein [Aliiglaciecola sp. 3_MG-2023]
MNDLSIHAITVHLPATKYPDSLGRKRIKVAIHYAEKDKAECIATLYLPIKETVYLISWLSTDVPHHRSNAKPLGLIKAAKLATLLTGKLDIDFKNDFQAYQFYKQHCDSSKLRLLLGNDADEIALKLEMNPHHKVLGGYLGGETESKDKSRFKSELFRQLNNSNLINLLLPQQIKKRNGKRLPNTFCQPLNSIEIKRNDDE